MKKKILIITYYWPPSGGAAVQRWLSFANKLAQKGWQVHLLTVDEKYATYQLRDESLLDKVDPRIKVHTTKTIEPFKAYTRIFGKNSIPKPAFSNENNPSFLKKLSRFIRGNFFIPDPRKGWKKYAVQKGLEIINAENIDRVITAGPPHSTHFIGKELREKKGIYWIADFHDLWTDVIYYDMLYHLPSTKMKDLKLERSILESADVILTVGNKYKERLQTKSSKLPADKIKILRIGYDESFFDGMSGLQQKEFVITYTGTIADFYKPYVFIEALKTIVDRHPDISFKLRFVGVLSGDIKNKIIQLGLQNILEETGYVSHKQAIVYLYQSTVLLLVNPAIVHEAMIIPGKLYEYLAVRKPIINITALDAETAAIVRQCASGETFDRTMQKEIEFYLEDLIIKWQQEKKFEVGEEECIKTYSRATIAEDLVHIIESNLSYAL